jgi:gluconokinase
MEKRIRSGQSAVLACSALKRVYRELLGVDQQEVKTVFLKGTFELLQQRLAARQGHFMPPELLRSQFDTLEVPRDGLTVDIVDSPEAVVSRIVTVLHQAASAAVKGSDKQP